MEDINVVKKNFLKDKELRDYIWRRKSVTFGGLLKRGLITKRIYDIFKRYSTADYAFSISDKEFDDMTINDLFEYYSENTMIVCWVGIGPKTISKLKNITGGL